jgi:phospholipid/cholesterol/gamma-HCH transport system substrate-binding protein
MQKRNIEILVGGFVLLGFLGLIFLALKAANLGSFSSGSGSYSVTARFDNVGGLKPKAAVKSAGVVVGRVDRIDFDDKSFQARVTVGLDSRYTFPKDSSLKILTAGLLGEQYLGLEPGAEEKMLAAGDTVSSTQSAVVLENLISQFLYSKASDGKGQ